MMRNNSSNPFRPGAFRTMLLAFAVAAPPCRRARAGQDQSQAQTRRGERLGEERRQEGRRQARATRSYGDWGAYAASGKDKTCYALGSPKERQPKAKMKDTQAFVFISTRPGEGVRNEVAINLGYATKDGGSATADVDDDKFELVTKGVNAWVKNPAKEKEFVEALRTGSKLSVKAASAKGTTTVDSYSLKGLSDALARVSQECK